MLCEAQGLKKGMQHPLPWYPPVCISLADIEESSQSYDHIQAVKDRNKVPLRLMDATMRLVHDTLKYLYVNIVLWEKSGRDRIIPMWGWSKSLAIVAMSCKDLQPYTLLS